MRTKIDKQWSQRGGSIGYEDSYRDENNSSHKLYFNLFSMLGKLVVSDGIVDKEEINIVNTYINENLKLDRQLKSWMINVFTTSYKSSDSFGSHATRVYEQHSDNRLFLEDIINVMLKISLADGKLSAEEEMLINEATIIFKIKDNAYSKYKSERGFKEESIKVKNEDYYKAILGLKGDIPFEKIKLYYHEIANKYHPDKVQHLGKEFQQLAEEKMKEINEAYQFFKRKYDFNI